MQLNRTQEDTGLIATRNKFGLRQDGPVGVGLARDGGIALAGVPGPEKSQIDLLADIHIMIGTPQLRPRAYSVRPGSYMHFYSHCPGYVSVRWSV